MKHSHVTNDVKTGTRYAQSIRVYIKKNHNDLSNNVVIRGGYHTSILSTKGEQILMYVLTSETGFNDSNPVCLRYRDRLRLKSTDYLLVATVSLGSPSKKPWNLTLNWSNLSKFRQLKEMGGRTLIDY